MAVINGNNNPNVLNGTAQADTINGFGGNDTIDAKTRPSASGSGIDVVDGGVGIDTLIVNASAEIQAVQLSTGGSPTFWVRSTSGNFYVDAYNMERVRFTGGSGSDTIDTGERGGTVNGGAGIDHWLANLGGLFSGVNFALGSTTSIAAAGLTSILGIERLTLTTGAGNDAITGGAQADTINTGDGNDIIDAKTRPTAAGSGTDFVDGGVGFDTLIVNAAAETQAVQLSSGGSPSFWVRSDSGNFYLDAYNMEKIQFTGGAGSDTINTGDRGGTVNGGGGIDHWLADLSGLTAGVSFTLGATTAIAAAGLTSLAGIERLTLTTGSGNDVITGGAQADSIRTGNGDDTINVRTRPTTAGSGTDFVDGGAGIDTLIVNAAAETNAVQLSSGGSPSFWVRSDSGNFYLDAYNMEKIQFTGGAGSDTINTGDRGGTVNGGGGIDHWLADLSGLTVGVGFTLGATTAIAAAGLTSLAGIERLTLTTGSGNDVITGGAQADSIRTGNGDDTINVRTRPTTAGSGTDFVDGGAGIDTLIVNAAAETSAVQLSSGGSPTFWVRSDSGNFYLDANNMEKIQFTGGAGSDTINTGDHGGTVNGGGGIDHWLADLSGLTVGVGFTLGATTAIAAAGLTSLAGIERLTLTTGSGNDVITGGAQADSIRTGNGNDTINAKTRPTTAGSGTDFVDGGAGLDTLVVNAAAETQSVQLFAGGSPSFWVRSNSGNFYLDAHNMERVVFTGGSAGDTASGGSGADVIATGGGADQLGGGDGNDVLNGGAGNDTVQGGRGIDSLFGGPDGDTFVFTRVVDSSVFNGQIDTIRDFATGVDTIDLSGIDADNLGANGNQAFTVVESFTGQAGELRIAAGLVEADVNGNGTADFRILLANNAAVAAGDLLL